MNFSRYKKFIMWWVSILLIGTGIFWANYFGVIQTIWLNDSTKLASVAAVVFVISNLALGWAAWKTTTIYSTSHTYQVAHKQVRKITDYCWFLSEMLMAIGMLGTVIGLIHMLEINAQAGGTVDPSMIAGMWKAMGLALYTNAVGLVGSIVLKFQTSIIGVDDEA